MLFVLSLAWDKKNSEFPQGIEPQTFGFRAPMFYHWATETPLWARSITKVISHSSCIPLRSAMSEKHLFLFLYRAQNLLSLSLLFLSKNITSLTWLIPAVESLRLSGRASERGIRRSEVRFLVETQIFFSLSHARDMTKNIFLFLYQAQNLPSLLFLFKKILQE